MSYAITGSLQGYCDNVMTQAALIMSNSAYAPSGSSYVFGDKEFFGTNKVPPKVSWCPTDGVVTLNNREMGALGDSGSPAVMMQNLSCRCWGSDYEDARTIFCRVYEAMKRVNPMMGDLKYKFIDNDGSSHTLGKKLDFTVTVPFVLPYAAYTTTTILTASCVVSSSTNVTSSVGSVWRSFTLVSS